MAFPAMGAGSSPPTEHTSSRTGPRYRKASPCISHMRSTQKFNVLIAANCDTDIAQAYALAQRIQSHSRIEVRCVVDDFGAASHASWHDLAGTNYRNYRTDNSSASRLLTQMGMTTSHYQHITYELCEWADILVLVPIDTRTIAMMLNGMTGDMILEILRSWDVTKKIIMVPGMTDLMWENPMTRKQLYEVRSKWNWVRVMSPILWKYQRMPNEYTAEGAHRSETIKHTWTGLDELVEMIQNQADLNAIGHDVDCTTSGTLIDRSQKTDKRLPPEIWSLIFQYVGDWETAIHLRIWTNLPVPDEWKNNKKREKEDPLQVYHRSLEWALLLEPVSKVLEMLAQAPVSLKYITPLAVKLTVKFALTPVLTYLEANHKDVFWTSFGSKLLPTLASAVYGRPEVLEWWRTAPSFLKKDYTIDAIDGASMSGFVHVLDWWHKSGLPLKYSEGALEQASSKGHILVLEWWRNASIHQGSHFTDSSSSSTSTEETSIKTSDQQSYINASSQVAPLRLKVGKSIIAAAQHGQVATLTWWDTSRIPYSHAESVCKTASAYGHVSILEEWKRLKGEKFAMAFDNQVLIGPTKNGFVKVLEWWKSQTLDQGQKRGDKHRRASEGASGGLVGGEGDEGSKGRLRVEYKTCDIEEALEDCVGREDEVDAIRIWWARNGLNLGVATSEWMQIKTL